jgi:hypothetical protein
VLPLVAALRNDLRLELRRIDGSHGKTLLSETQTRPDPDSPSIRGKLNGHHVVWFSKHGPTNLKNLVLVCRRHHRRLHRKGWEAKLLPDATLHITDPLGNVRTSRPPGALDTG